MESSSPKIVVHPLIIMLGYVVLSGIARRLWPLPIPDLPLLLYGGCILMATGVSVLLLAMRAFSKKQVGFGFVTGSTVLITESIYRYTRNPIYLAFILNFSGMALISGSYWDLLLIAMLVIALNQIVIAKEEAYLSEKFKDQYESYKSSVRRWV